MQDRGLSVMETARRVREHLPEGESISQASISHYRTGRAMPRLRYLDALSLALGVPKSELMNPAKQSEAARSTASAAPAAPVAERWPHAERAAPEGCVQFVDLGDRMRLRVDQVLPWSTGLQILEILRGSASEPDRKPALDHEGPALPPSSLGDENKAT